MVPLAHHLEIPRAGAERRASAPAVHLQQIGGRGEHVRHGMAQIDATVSVEIDSVFDVGGWQELGLPDLAGIGADEVAQRQVAARQNVQRGDELALEQLAAAAIMSEGGECADHRKAAHVAGAVVTFHGPDRHQQRRRHAELPLDTGQQRRVAGHQHAGAPEPGFRHARCRVPLEAHSESAVLAAVEGEYSGVDRDAGERLVDYATRESGRLRVARHGGKEAVKVPAASRRPRWRSEEEDEEQCCKRALHHRPSFTIPLVPAQAGTAQSRRPVSSLACLG
jgi:hypothetical protein